MLRKWRHKLYLWWIRRIVAIPPRSAIIASTDLQRETIWRLLHEAARAPAAIPDLPGKYLALQVLPSNVETQARLMSFPTSLAVCRYWPDVALRRGLSDTDEQMEEVGREFVRLTGQFRLRPPIGHRRKYDLLRQAIQPKGVK